MQLVKPARSSTKYVNFIHKTEHSLECVKYIVHMHYKKQQKLHIYMFVLHNSKHKLNILKWWVNGKGCSILLQDKYNVTFSNTSLLCQVIVVIRDSANVGFCEVQTTFIVNFMVNCRSQ